MDAYNLSHIINRKEIAVFGIKRCGNHAIIHWLIQHMGKHVVHLNDVTGKSPYDSYTEINVKGLPICQPRLNVGDPYPQLAKNHNVIEYSMKDKSVNWDAIRFFTPKDCLIISYENSFLEDNAYAQYVKQHDNYVGRSKQRYRVLILRDAYNLFASLLRASFVTAQDIKQCIKLYKQYAEVFLDPDKQEKLNVICINYNEWFINPDYRIWLAQRFGVNINGAPFQKVPSIGGGSSFEGMSKNGKAQEMKVFERWKAYRENPAYRAIFQDSYLVELSNAIFGQIVPVSWQS